MPARSSASRIDSPSTKATTTETLPGSRSSRSRGPGHAEHRHAPRQLLDQALLQGALVREVVLAARLRDRRGAGEADDGRRVLGAGAPPLLLAAAEDLRRHGRAGALVEHARASRPVELVRRRRQQVDAEPPGVDAEVRGRLHGVGVHQRARVARVDAAADLGDVVDRADLVVRVHHGDERRVVAHSRLDLGGVGPALGVDADDRQLGALALELLGGVEHGVVLDGGGHEVAPPAGRAERAAQREAVRLRSARGEDNLARRRAQPGRDGRPRLIERLLGALRLDVNRGGVVPAVLEPGPHRLDHGRVGRRGGGVVQVDASCGG